MSLDRALTWAAAGWPVFPTRNGKPLADWDWRTRNTTDPAVVREWWAEPDLGVACVPGLVGCWVLDVDVKGGKNGRETLSALEADHDFETWEAPRQTTRSGGTHLFFAGTVATTTGTIGDGLDTRGGSSASGLGFIFCHAERPPAAPGLCPPGPAPLVSRIGRPRERADRIDGTPPGGWDLPENVRRATRYLSSVAAPPDGERNITLFKHACAVRDIGVSEGELQVLLTEHPAALGDPPLDAEEAETTIASAYRNAQLDAGNRASSGGLEKLAAEVWAARPSGRQRLALWSERRDRPAPSWLWHELLPAGGLVGLYGQGGSYKTFLALRLAVAISSGNTASLGGHTLRHGPVVYVAGEGAQEPRLRALEAAYGSISDNLALFDGLDLTSEADQAILRDDIQMAISDVWKCPPVLIVVDTLNRAAPGMDENSARDMSSVVATCDAMRRALGCAVLLVHHTPKGSDDWRGSTAVWNALDAALLVKRDGALKAKLYARRVKDAQDGEAWDVSLRAEGKSVVVRDLVKRVSHAASGGDIGPSKTEAAQRIREHVLGEARAKVAKDILSVVGTTMATRTLTRQIVASLEGSDGESIRGWLRSVVKKGGGINEAHPLADCVATLSPLSFGQPAE